MAKTDLLKEAIADAKAVRETALANAKIALEEAFTPRIQSMLSAKLSEEEGEEDYGDEIQAEDDEYGDEIQAEEDSFTGDGTPDDGLEDVDEASDSSDIGKGDNKVDSATASDEEEPGKGKLAEQDEEEVDLEEIINALREEEGDEETVEEDQDTAGVDDGAAAKELDEAYKVIRFMKSKLNEVNLLNAKLLFSNKLYSRYNT